MSTQLDRVPNRVQNKVRLATVWLDGCSGCHMSFLDIDERIIELADNVQLVYGPLMDAKEFPEGVDVTLVEGAISSEEDLEKIRLIRERTKILVSLGDCAVTGNVPSMRNPFGTDTVLNRVYPKDADMQVPTQVVPPLLKRVRPVHQVVKVDVFVPGCPPSAKAIWRAVSELLAGHQPDLTGYTRFGA
jgi:NAD-reducing hydrogenase small subunit